MLPGLTFSPIDQPGGFGAAVLAAWAAAGSPGDLGEFSAGLRPTAVFAP